MPTFEQVYTQVADSLVLSTLVAAIPIVVLFVLLAGFRVAAHWSSLVSLGLALVIAVAVYGMPVSLALNSTLMGIAFGLFPIVWIVINAIWIYNLVVDTGQFDVVRNSLASLSNDRRIQVVLIAFILGALLANTAPVAFGGFAIPIITGASVAQIDTMELSQMVGRQTPLLALIVPGFLVTVMAGWRRMLEVWPVIVVSGVSFAGAQFVVSNFIGPELADLLAAIVGVVAVVALLAVWSPREEWHFPNEPAAAERESYERPPFGATLLAWSPFIVIIVIFLLAQIEPMKGTLRGIEAAVNFPTAEVNEQGKVAVGWPGLDGQVTRQPPAVGEAAPYPAKYQTDWLSAAGTLILIADIISLFILRVGPGRALRIYGQTLNQLKWAILTIGTILGLAYLFNYSGMTYTLGLAFAATGVLFRLVLPWSIALTVVMAIIIMLQAYVFTWMVPGG